ncbi:uncharacterized protein LOC143179495 [Calliopsis andreniformis]|uniref:uncharacterized protein LOC143179495 n=1 Tax=Calliopsis andreniformis TaxID=337506 RepID=UPI003FCCCF15
MFRDGQYLEVIKASETCLATVVVTVQERTIKIKKKTVSTNKWLDLEDWAALYNVLERAILRNIRPERSLRDLEKCKWKKSTRQLEITYTIEPSENVKDITSLPTIRVNVSPAKTKSEKAELSEATLERGEFRTLEKLESDALDCVDQKDNYDRLPKASKNSDTITKVPSNAKSDKNKRYLHLNSLESDALEEYVPDAPAAKKLCTHLKYIPSRKSTLERIQSSNEYSPMLSDNKSVTEVIRYIPNSVDSSKVSYETYEPHATTIVDPLKEYVPTLKGTKTSIEEYQPDFTSKLMKFDDSYIPSSVQLTTENSKKLTDKTKKQQLEKQPLRRKDSSSKKNTDLFT